jgi:hypothetical protein
MKLGTQLSIVRGGALPMNAQTIQEPVIHHIQDGDPIVNGGNEELPGLPYYRFLKH